MESLYGAFTIANICGAQTTFGSGLNKGWGYVNGTIRQIRVNLTSPLFRFRRNIHTSYHNIFIKEYFRPFPWFSKQENFSTASQHLVKAIKMNHLLPVCRGVPPPMFVRVLRSFSSLIIHKEDDFRFSVTQLCYQIHSYSKQPVFALRAWFSCFIREPP